MVHTGRATPRRVAIVGGGPAGLSAASQLSLFPSDLSITLFDRRSTHAGIWTYDPAPGPCIIKYDSTGRPHALWSGSRKDGDDAGTFTPPGAMYDGLRTNLPCDVMGFRSHPYASDTSLFPDRARVEGYIEAFARTAVGESVDVRLETSVTRVQRTSHTPVEDKIGWGSKWGVASTNLATGEKREEVYDHVVLASGRCNTPSIPRIPGLPRFKGTILHSAWYRSPLPFEEKTVLVVGNSSSGSDIARELSGYVLRTLPEGPAATAAYLDRKKRGEGAGTVLHSYEHIDKPPPLDYDPREEGSPDWARRIQVVPRIEGVDQDGSVVFEGGERRGDVDVIVFATGFSYDFPYLPQDVAPFNSQPLIPLPPTPVEGPASTASATPDLDKPNSPASSSLDKLSSCPDGAVSSPSSEVYTPSSRTAPFLTHLDDWSLFYAPDPSLCVLGAPIRIVPMPLTHVQSRVVGAAWAGRLGPASGSTGLPRLDAALPSTDPEKWTSRCSDVETQEAQREVNRTGDLGYPSDSAYQDALLALLPADLRASGRDEGTTVPNPADEGGVTAQPVAATDEGWATMPTFRNQRRADTKRLRRALLGY